MRFTVFGGTDVGRKRNHNEDAFALFEEDSLFVLADGMGGHASGEVASQLAVDSVGAFFKETAEDQERTWPFKGSKKLNYDAGRLEVAVKLANQCIFETSSQKKTHENMGTTVVATYMSPQAAYIAHVGDSRVYRLRDGKLEQLTRDHSLLNDYLKTNRLTPEEIEAFPHKNVIVRALGMRATVEVDIAPIEPRVGDFYVLCSDGLSGMITDDEIADIIQRDRIDLERCTNALIEQANESGGHDNVTVVLIRVDADEDGEVLTADETMDTGATVVDLSLEADS